MKKEDNSFGLNLDDYKNDIGLVDSIHVRVGNHQFEVHLCGRKRCKTIDVPVEKYEVWPNVG